MITKITPFSKNEILYELYTENGRLVGAFTIKAYTNGVEIEPRIKPGKFLVTKFTSFSADLPKRKDLIFSAGRIAIKMEEEK